MFRAWKSTTLRGSPVGLGCTTILLHHWTGSLTGTFSSTPSLQSLSRPPLTASCQCRGTWAGVWTATGLAEGSTCSRSGGLPVIKGKGCFWQMLKAEELNLLRMYSLRIGRLLTVAGQGSVGFSVGGRLRTGHLHSSVPGMITPVLVHLVGEDDVPTAHTEEDGDLGGQDPTRGKLCGITCNFMQTSWLMYTLLTAVLTYMSCRQEISSPSAVLPVISTNIPPRREIGSDDAPSILDWRGRRVSWWIPRSVSVETPQTAIWAPVSITEGVVVDLEGFLSLLEKVGGARPSCL